MKKDYFKIVCVVFGMLFALFSSCKKNNHNTIAFFGDEKYMKSIDSIYPEGYRDEWKILAPGYEDTVYNGFFPPDLTGEFLITGKFGAGNEWIHRDDEDIPYPYNDDIYALNKYVYFRVKDQKNGIAKLYFCMYNKPDGNSRTAYTVDTAYIYGKGNKNEFTLCFDAIEVPGNTGIEYDYGIIITGKRHYPDTINPAEGISDVKMWRVIKNRGGNIDNVAFYWIVGGQRLYYDADNFAEKVDYGWGF